MQDQNQKSVTGATALVQKPNPVVDAAQVAKEATVAAEEKPKVSQAAQGDFVKKIVDKIKSSENILVALSKNPTVDEIAAAVGLTLFLDEMQKHTTAIYSGRTPDALSFLRPDATFESDTASLQDFIIALNKDKADHLRYKLDGDFVKVYITPYKTSITEEDLTFAQGDYNVDFVIALNVRSAGDLDEALAEHGRIMHDASAVDITTGEPGRFGEIEWSNPAASSVCEMVTELIFALQGSDSNLDPEVATALLTGIVAATDRFSNAKTSSETLSLASKLMTMGADQQLITANVAGNEIIQNGSGEPSAAALAAAQAADAGMFVEPVSAGMNEAVQLNAESSMQVSGATEVSQPVSAESVVVQPVLPQVNDPSVLSLPGVNMPMPGVPSVPATLEVTPVVREMATTEPSQTEMPQVGTTMQRPEPSNEAPVDYGQMMEQALAEPVATPSQPVIPAADPGAMAIPNTPVMQNSAPVTEQVAVNPAVAGAPAEVLGEPVENPFQMTLPPPPAPEVGPDMMPPAMPKP